MKKCAKTFLFIATAAIAACTGYNSADSNLRGVDFATTDTTAVFTLNALDKNSPKCEAVISLAFAKGDDETAKGINSAILYAAFGYEGLTPKEAIDSFLGNMQAEYNELRNDYINEKQMEEFPAWLNHTYSLQGGAYEGRDGIICYDIESYSFEGGAHGISSETLLNIDKETGREIYPADVFKPGFETELTKRLIGALARKIGATDIDGIMEKGYLTLGDMFPTDNFAMEKDSMVFLYNVYEIAPYYLGSTRLTLGYDELKDLMK